MTEADFNKALWIEVLMNVAGAQELWDLYNRLAEDAEGDVVLAQVDAYKDSASPEARAVYFSIINNQ